MQVKYFDKNFKAGEAISLIADTEEEAIYLGRVYFAWEEDTQHFKKGYEEELSLGSMGPADTKLASNLMIDLNNDLVVPNV